MNNKFITKASLIVNKASLQVKKHSPEILMVTGIVSGIGSTILACKATRKVDAILEEKKFYVEKIHECLEDKEVKYTEQDSKKDLTITYVQTGVKLLKLYSPAIGLGLLSIGCIVSGNKILSKRNAALVAAYTAVDKGFKKYRSNVVERFGEEVDHQLRHNIKAKEIETTTKTKNGKEKTTKEVVFEQENPLEGISEYAKFFDAGSDEFKKDPEYNLMFLRRQQDYANEVLQHKGYIFLNEVYDLLGIPRTKAGQVVGWIYNKDNPEGDNYVDFGIYNPKEANRRFVDGYEYNILLDFNVDGVIYDKI